MSEADVNSASSFIDPLSPPQLSKASRDGGMDPSSKKLRDLEWRTYIGKRRLKAGAQPAELPDEAPDDLAAIALSGGGIRSATFALGALQALAHRRLLERFDYLSTVSGGGYTGTSLTWLTSKLATELADADQKRADDEARAINDERAGTSAAAADDDSPRFPPAGFGLGPSPTRAALRGPARPLTATSLRRSPTAARIRAMAGSLTARRPRTPCCAICDSTAIT